MEGTIEVIYFNLIVSVLVAHKTTEQANLVGETAVAGANQVSEKTVEGLESVVTSAGLVKQVSKNLKYNIL